MKPWLTIGTAAHGKHSFALKQRGAEFLVQVDGKVLMGSRRHGSEEALATVGCERLRGDHPRVLIGGLGFGYTLRAALDVLPAKAEVVVAELIPAIVEWNRGPLADLAGRPVEDPRVSIETADVKTLIARGGYDAILLDVDNGPVAVTRDQNTGLYDNNGARACMNGLNAKGRLVVWSAGFDPRYERTLAQAGFKVQTKAVSATGKDGGEHVLFIADRP